LAAQTGASLFLQVHSPPYTDPLASPSSHWTYNKTESIPLAALTSSPQITHLIVESDADVQYCVKSGEWELVDNVWGFEGWRLPTREVVRGDGKGTEVWDLMPRMEKREKLWIMERRG